MVTKDILLDTNAYSAFKRNVAEAVVIVQQAPLINLSSVVLGELLGGFALGTRETFNRQELQQFLTSPRVEVLTINEHTAQWYARRFIPI